MHIINNVSVKKQLGLCYVLVPRVTVLVKAIVNHLCTVYPVFKMTSVEVSDVVFRPNWAPFLHLLCEVVVQADFILL